MLNSESGDGLGMLPRIGEPESSLEPGMAAGRPRDAPQGLIGITPSGMPDTSIGPVALQEPGQWSYDFDPGTGQSRATFNGEVTFTSGGSGTAGVTSWNTRTGAVSLTTADVTGVGGALANNAALTGTPTAPTASAGTSTTQLATTAFVAQAMTANPTVQSFNGRTGAVTLSLPDITTVGGAPAASPNLTGNPQAPTPALGNASSSIATTQFVANAIAGGTVTTWNGRQGAVSLTLSDVQSVGGAPIASPNFTGTPTGSTAAPGTATTQLATTAFVTNAVTSGTAGVASFNTRTGAVSLTASDVTGAGGALLNSPTFTGTPQAPTPTAGDSSIKLATTAFVGTAIANLPAGVSTFNGRSGTVTLTLADVTSVGGAPLASPAFSGTPTTTTPTTGDNSSRVASTAFIAAALPVPASVAPVMDGTAAVGTSLLYARQDHVHPTDTSRYAASNPSNYQTAAQVTASLGSYLPLAGGTITGSLTVDGNLTAASGTIQVNQVGSGNVVVQLNNNASSGLSQWFWNQSNSSVTLNNVPAGSSYVLDGSGNCAMTCGGSANLILQNNNAYKPGGGSWAALSDARIKTEIGDYGHGLDEIIALRPIVYVYNDKQSMHREAAEKKQPFVGLIAQEAERAMPELVLRQQGAIDGDLVDDLRSLDATPLIFALVNAVKTLKARLEALEQA